MSAPTISWSAFKTWPHGFTIHEASHEGLDARIYHAKDENGKEGFQIKISPSFPPGPHVTENFLRPELDGAKQRAAELLRATAATWDPFQSQLEAEQAKALYRVQKARKELDGIRADQLEAQASVDYLAGRIEQGPLDSSDSWKAELKTALDHLDYTLGRAQGIKYDLEELDQIRDKMLAIQERRREQEDEEDIVEQLKPELEEEGNE